MALRQTSIWLDDKAVAALKRIGKRPDVDREWTWLARKAIDDLIARYDAERAKSDRRPDAELRNRRK
jgi:predicted transcriptional regulator